MLQTPMDATSKMAAVRRVGHLVARVDCTVISILPHLSEKYATNRTIWVLCQNCVLVDAFADKTGAEA